VTTMTMVTVTHGMAPRWEARVQRPGLLWGWTRLDLALFRLLPGQAMVWRLQKLQAARRHPPLQLGVAQKMQEAPALCQQLLAASMRVRAATHPGMLTCPRTSTPIPTLVMMTIYQCEHVLRSALE